MTVGLLAAASCGAADLHTSLSAESFRPESRVWTRGYGFDAQFGSWVVPYLALALALGSDIVDCRAQTIHDRVLAASPDGLNTSQGVVVIGRTPCVFGGPSIWATLPIPGPVGLSAELDGRYVYMPHGPSVLGTRYPDPGYKPQAYGEPVDIHDGIVLRAGAQAELRIQASASAFLGVARQRTVSGLDAELGGASLGRFDLDGWLVRAGLRGSW
jgi:hypothetical protein